MKKVISVLLSSFILSCQSNNIIVKPYQETNSYKKENVIDLGNKGPSVKININFNKNNPFNIKNISDSFNGLSSISRLEIRLSNSQEVSFSDRFGLDCPCPPNTRKGVAYINITNPSLNNSITVKGLKPNTDYYISARAYAYLKVSGTDQEINVTSSDGTVSDTIGGGTAGGLINLGNEEYISVDNNGVLTINNDNGNHDWDISLQLMKSKGASISQNSGLVEDGNDTTNYFLKPNYSSLINPNILVSKNLSNQKFYPNVAIANNGRYMITWTENNGTDYDILARLYDKNLNPLTDEIIVNETATGDQKYSYIDTDGNNFIVVWEGNGSGDSNGIFARKFDNNANPIGSEFKVNTNTSGNQEKPKVSTNSSGNAVFVWQSDETGNNDIKAQRYNFSSGFISGELTINSYTIGNQNKPSIGIDNMGNFIVSWEGEGQGDNDGIFFKKFDNTGIAVTDDIRVNENTSNIQKINSLSIDKITGNFVISFVSNDNYIHLQRYYNDARKKYNEIVFDNFNPISSNHVSINQYNDIYLIWKKNNNIFEIRKLDFNDSTVRELTFSYNTIDIGNTYLDDPFIYLTDKYNVFVWKDSILSDSSIYFQKMTMQ